ncbi:hypothetical protein O181_095097 [Austropuccinia psidii MF-1]|uniref:Uncharacterized protein n=1 Tax=Austropuccinia psidii MF-1 TaxID=1389203 RepID=A0A9Q3PC58_9BASI|nr:hypothetical protein [Austropuccinia psidii MF-1]
MGNKITPLRNQEGNLKSKISEKESLIFHGTSILETIERLRDIPHQHPPNIPPINEENVETTISKLPSRNAPGPEDISKELIKLEQNLQTPLLINLYNLCLKQRTHPKKIERSPHSNNKEGSQRQLYQL